MLVVVVVMMVVPFFMIVIVGLPRIVVVVMACMIVHVRTAVAVRVFGCGRIAMVVPVDVWMRMGVGMAVTVPAGKQGPDQEANAGEHQHATDDLPFVSHDGIP